MRTRRRRRARYSEAQVVSLLVALFAVACLGLVGLFVYRLAEQIAGAS